MNHVTFDVAQRSDQLQMRLKTHAKDAKIRPCVASLSLNGDRLTAANSSLPLINVHNINLVGQISACSSANARDGTAG